MRYKIIRDVNISGKTSGDIIDVEPHAVEAYLERGEVELAAPLAPVAPVVEEKPAPVKKAKVVVKKRK